MSIKEMILNTFTGKDNITIDMGRVLWCVGVFVYFGLSIYDIYIGHTFDPAAWGTGLGLVLAGGGAAIALKAKTEPDS